MHISPSPLVIIGNGGFGREVLELVRDINRDASPSNPGYDVRGFLTNDSACWGSSCNGVPVLGDESWIAKYLAQYPVESINVVIGIGSPMFKKRLVDKLAPLGSRVKFPNLIHPNVIMGSHINLGVGNIITAGNILTCNIEIASHVMVNLACTVGHDSIFENFVVVSPKSAISGNTTLKEGCYLGTGCTVIEKKTIGSWSVVGGAALVNKDVPDNATVVGVPGVVIKTRERGWHLE